MWRVGIDDVRIVQERTKRNKIRAEREEHLVEEEKGR